VVLPVLVVLTSCCKYPSSSSLLLLLLLLLQLLQETKCFHDSFLLDTETWEWKECSLPDLGYRVGHTAVLAPPLSSTSSSGSTISNNYDATVLLFGGQDRMGKRCEELRVLELEEGTAAMSN